MLGLGFGLARVRFEIIVRVCSRIEFRVSVKARVSVGIGFG